jgi:hypothetical protein
MLDNVIRLIDWLVRRERNARRRASLAAQLTATPDKVVMPRELRAPIAAEPVREAIILDLAAYAAARKQRRPGTHF